MHPILGEVFGYKLHMYGALGAMAFLLMSVLALVSAYKKGWETARFGDLIFVTTMAGIVGARLVFLLQNPEFWPVAFNIRGGGLVFYGSVLLGVPAALLWIRRIGLNPHEVADVFAPLLPLAHAISRVGCFFAGCCYGSPSGGPLSVIFPPGSQAPAGVSLHPVQVYEAGGLLVVSALAWAVARNATTRGLAFCTYIAGYSLVRLITESFRGDLERGFILNSRLSFSQGLSIVLGLCAILYAGFLIRQSQQRLLVGSQITEHRRESS